LALQQGEYGQAKKKKKGGAPPQVRSKVGNGVVRMDKRTYKARWARQEKVGKELKGGTAKERTEDKEGETSTVPIVHGTIVTNQVRGEEKKRKEKKKHKKKKNPRTKKKEKKKKKNQDTAGLPLDQWEVRMKKKTSISPWPTCPIYQTHSVAGWKDSLNFHRRCAVNLD